MFVSINDGRGGSVNMGKEDSDARWNGGLRRMPFRGLCELRRFHVPRSNEATTATTETHSLEPVLGNKRSHSSEKPSYRNPPPPPNPRKKDVRVRKPTSVDGALLWVQLRETLQGTKEAQCSVFKDFEAFKSTKRGSGHQAAINRSTCRDPERTQREEWKAGTKKLPSPLACADLGAAFFYSLIKYGGVPTIFQALLKPWGYAAAESGADSPVAAHGFSLRGLLLLRSAGSWHYGGEASWKKQCVPFNPKRID
ncbi:hypothetical protein JEQ12_017328 [Ovis aries]|uniref:Uncharacterized protein n=1 Tax=Ovis aries TaxID=9940 RepID=A0A836A1N2_SHEEP|nr:hypothetical protein JEQ12_017328 [Ovis aries]